MLNKANGPVVALSLVLVALSLARWHRDAVSAPVLLEDPTPGFVLVVNERDCAESPRWLAHWIGPLLEADVAVGATLVRSVADSLENLRLGNGIVLPLLEETFPEKRVMQILSRAGVQHTPALILLDERGAPVLVEALYEGPSTSIEPLARAFAGLHRARNISSRSSEIAP